MENCDTVPSNESIFDESDDTMLKIIVTVNDINDNPPKFMNDVFTGGVTTDADFGTQFMNVKVRLDANIEKILFNSTFLGY